jgi:hypothetical protein
MIRDGATGACLGVKQNMRRTLNVTLRPVRNRILAAVDMECRYGRALLHSLITLPQGTRSVDRVGLDSESCME